VRDDLKGLKGGSARTWENFFDTLWTIATVRYVTCDQLKKAFPEATWRKKCATPKMLTGLADLGYLTRTEAGVFSATAKAIDLLKECSKHNTEIIKPAGGKGEGDSLVKAEAFLDLIKQPEFFALFFPEFYESPRDAQPFLVPDGALVLRRDGKAKLAFLEIERPKSNWEDHLRGKKTKYEWIAGQEKTWAEWWAQWCQALKLEPCAREEFGFSILCIGGVSFAAENWKGWKFKA
jgi:hypothetical protein